jgi:hypothetical protein
VADGAKQHRTQFLLLEPNYPLERLPTPTFNQRWAFLSSSFHNSVLLHP